MTYEDLRARYESGTPAERQKVLDMLDIDVLDKPIRWASDVMAAWERAMRQVFESDLDAAQNMR
jgi:hypothetical protein